MIPVMDHPGPEIPIDDWPGSLGLKLKSPPCAGSAEPWNVPPLTEAAVPMSSARELLKTDLFDEIEDHTLTSDRSRLRDGNLELL